MRIGALLLVVSMLTAGCATPPPRGYYAPDGVAPTERLSWYEERGPSAHLALTVQGVYVNEVDGEPTQTLHAQLRLTSPRAAPVTLLRDRWVADLRPAPGAPPESLVLSEVWSGLDPIPGDLHAEGWSRRSFDLFFDRPYGGDEPVPVAVRLRWAGSGSAGPLVGQCRFVRIPEDSPVHPSDVLLSDPSFGLRDGYYMPGAAHLGPRRLVPRGEHRLHYPFHRPRSWRL